MGSWVKAAKDSGYWDCAEDLEAYSKDMEFDLNTALMSGYRSIWYQELKDDFKEIKERVESLRKVVCYNFLLNFKELVDAYR